MDLLAGLGADILEVLPIDGKRKVGEWYWDISEIQEEDAGV